MPDDPAVAKDPQVQAYFEFIKKYAPEEPATDATPMIGYIMAGVMVDILKNCGDDLTRENSAQASEQLRQYAGVAPGRRCALYDDARGPHAIPRGQDVPLRRHTVGRLRGSYQGLATALDRWRWPSPYLDPRHSHDLQASGHRAKARFARQAVGIRGFDLTHWDNTEEWTDHSALERPWLKSCCKRPRGQVR